MKTIIIHHLQKMWDVDYQKQGTCFEEELEKVYKHIKENDYDKIIVTNFEAGRGLDEDQWLLSEFNPRVYDYMYGWERSEVESWGTYKEGVHFCEGGNHSEIVLIDEWMRELEGDVYLCGAFDGECIEDITIALQGAGKTVKRIEYLIK